MSVNSRARGPPLTPVGALKTSAPRILPPGPLPAPESAVKSIPFSAAKRLAKGLANNRPPIPTEETVDFVAMGCGGAAVDGLGADGALALDGALGLAGLTGSLVST